MLPINVVRTYTVHWQNNGAIWACEKSGTFDNLVAQNAYDAAITALAILTTQLRPNPDLFDAIERGIATICDEASRVDIDQNTGKPISA